MSPPYSEICLLHVSLWFLAWLISRPSRWRRHVPPKRRLTINGLHGVISRKIELITNSCRTHILVCAQVVRHWYLTATRVTCEGHWNTLFSKYLWLPLLVIIPPLFHGPLSPPPKVCSRQRNIISWVLKFGGASLLLG
jgi:hypothetical protein